MNAEQVAHILRARRGSGYWIAKCPAHGRDRHPSLSIRQGKDGKVLLNCFVGCETKDILESMGLTFGDLYLDADKEAWLTKKRAVERKCPSVTKPSFRKPLGVQEAVYRYTNEHGELVAEKLRFEGKVFLWRRPNGAGWAWTVDREELPLYRLHEVAKAHAVYLVEGEKDADNLTKCLPRWSAVAVTTAPNGAKSWRAKYARWFAGKKVWIIPDTDRPGLEYAGLAATHISKTAQSVRVVSLSPAKDVSAYLLQHAPAELSILLRGAPLWTAPRRIP